jgi:internalin A
VRYRFLHEGILRTFLSRIGEQAGDGAVFWKYGCWFCEEKTKAAIMVQSKQGTRADQPGAGEVILDGWGSGAAKLVDGVLETLLRIPVGRPPEVARETKGPGDETKRPHPQTESRGHQGIEDLKIVPRSELPEQGPRRVYVSYAWGDDSPLGRQREVVVESLCAHIRGWGYRVERDKEVMGVGDLISDFIASIGRSDCVVVILSEKYLRSGYCMNELHQIYLHSRSDKADFLRRVVPLTLADAAIGAIRDRAEHALHWETERENLRPLLSRGVLGPSDYTEWMRMGRWVSDVSEMLAHINDKLHARGLDAIVADNFAEVRSSLEGSDDPERLLGVSPSVPGKHPDGGRVEQSRDQQD